MDLIFFHFFSHHHSSSGPSASVSTSSTVPLSHTGHLLVVQPSCIQNHFLVDCCVDCFSLHSQIHLRVLPSAPYAQQQLELCSLSPPFLWLVSCGCFFLYLFFFSQRHHGHWAAVAVAVAVVEVVVAVAEETVPGR